MQKSFPFNAVMTSEGYDRVYTAEDFAEDKAAYMSDGFLTRDALEVTPVSGRTVSLSLGRACIRGRTYYNTEPIEVTLALSDASYARIDRIVLRLDYTERNILVHVKQGTPSSNPKAPEVTDNEQMFEIPIASITVAANTSVIVKSAIADERIFAKYPLDYDKIVAEYTQELRDSLGVEDLNELKKIAQSVIVTGSGDKALFDDGIYRSPAVLYEAARYTSSGTFSTYEHPSKDNLYHIILLGGGGSGSAKSHMSNISIPSGGGAGALFNMGPVYIPDGVHTVIVGEGGIVEKSGEGTDGGDTSFLSYSAGGGKAGNYTTTASDSENTGGKGLSCYPGEAGLSISSGGKGGSSIYGIGGKGTITHGMSGVSATGYGAGGGCGGATGIGGNGTGGLAIIFGYR